jgi:hypothetical protein
MKGTRAACQGKVIHNSTYTYYTYTYYIGGRGAFEVVRTRTKLFTASCE